jgi:mono/diheme cytochrome c family protein
MATTACGDRGPATGPVVGVASVMESPTPAPALAAPAPAGPTLEDLTVRYPAYAQGIRVYRAQYCGTCHTLGAAAAGGVFGPTHDGLRPTAEARIQDPTYSGSARTAEEYVRESIVRPGIYRVSGYEVTRFLMPAYTNLSEADVDALVHLLLNLDAGDQ